MEGEIKEEGEEQRREEIRVKENRAGESIKARRQRENKQTKQKNQGRKK